jgi:hypothetical protein
MKSSITVASCRPRPAGRTASKLHSVPSRLPPPAQVLLQAWSKPPGQGSLTSSIPRDQVVLDRHRRYGWLAESGLRSATPAPLPLEPWPSMTLSPFAAAAAAGLARASAVSAAATAPVPPASSCRLVLRLVVLVLARAVMASSRSVSWCMSRRGPGEGQRLRPVRFLMAGAYCP